MIDRDLIYEVFLNLVPVWSKAEDRPVHSWSWRQLNSQGLIAINGDTHVKMRDAFCAAMAFRKQAGGAGVLKINLDGIVPECAKDVRHCTDPFEVELQLRSSLH